MGKIIVIEGTDSSGKETQNKSANASFENTHTILVELLKSKESFDDSIFSKLR